MAVSYLSTIFRNSAYVPPVDINLLAKVDSYKQGLFDTNYEKIQNQINQESTLDVMKGEDRDYLNNKINNLVNNLNGLGGVDLGDYNVSNQIESYASDIYKDDNVLNAISSTKRIRTLQQSYDNMRTNPKLSKYYSDANYTLDMENVQNYLNDGQVGSTYNGNSSATPYYDYNKEFQDSFKNLVANKYSQITPDGYYINKQTGEYIKPDQVAQEARGLMSMNARGQMERDSIYLYKYKAGWGKQQIVDKALQSDYQDIQNTKDYIDQTQKDLAIEQDPTKKVQLKQNLQKYQDLLKKQNFDFGNNRYDYESLYDQNPNELMYKAFSDDYFNALGLKYGYNRVTNDLVADPVKAMIFRAQQERDLKQSEFENANQLLDKKIQADRENTILKAQIDAGTASIDPTSGQIIYGSAAGNGSAEDIKANIQSIDESKLADTYKDWIKNGYTQSINGIASNYWSGLVADNPELKVPEFGYNSYTNQTTDQTFNNRMKDPKLLAKMTPAQRQAFLKPQMNYDFDQNGVIDIRDFQRVVTKTGQKTYELIQDKKQRDIIAHAVQALSDLANGRPTNISKLPAGTADFVEQLQLLDQKKKNYETALNKYAQGQEGFLRDQYAAKVIPSDEKTQNSRGVSSVKSYLQANGLSGSGTPIINEIGPALDGSNNFSLYYSIRTANGKTELQKPVTVSPDIAKELGIQSGNYDVLNTTVDKDNDFHSYVQNLNDPSFVSYVRVYKYGNNNEYKAQYKLSDGTWVNIPASPYSSDPLVTSTAAMAYDRAKTMLQNYGNNLSKDDRVNLRSLFENSLLNANK